MNFAGQVSPNLLSSQLHLLRLCFEGFAKRTNVNRGWLSWYNRSSEVWILLSRVFLARYLSSENARNWKLPTKKKLPTLYLRYIDENFSSIVNRGIRNPDARIHFPKYFRETACCQVCWIFRNHSSNVFKYY